MEFSGKFYLMHLLTLNCTFMAAMLVCCAQFAREKSWLTALLQQTFCSVKGMYTFFHFYQLLKFIIFLFVLKSNIFVSFLGLKHFSDLFLVSSPSSKKKSRFA